MSSNSTNAPLPNPTGTSENLCSNKECTVSSDDLWVFGYGSMIWKADFPFICKHRGFIKGFERRFYQNSLDHRGTSEKPGRVVTLINNCDINAKTYGMAYRIAQKDIPRVLEHLDYREINGYERLDIDFYMLNEGDEEYGTITVLLYIATPENPSFAGTEDTYDKIAVQVCTSVGKSGTNTDYVFKLAEAFRSLYPKIQDQHLFDLETAVKRQMSFNSCQG